MLTTPRTDCAKNRISFAKSTPILLSTPLRKNISLYPSGKSYLKLRASRASQEGRFAIVTICQVRDAMDAASSTDE